MSFEKIICPKCGYRATYGFAGGKGKISFDEVEMAQTCEDLGTGHAGNGCQHLDREVLRPRPAQ